MQSDVGLRGLFPLVTNQSCQTRKAFGDLKPLWTLSARIMQHIRATNRIDVHDARHDASKDPFGGRGRGFPGWLRLVDLDSGRCFV